MPRPDIFTHDTLLSFLQATVVHKKETNPKWSVGIWARQLKMGNTASLARLINGTRVPGQVLATLIERDLQLAARETEYFQCLVLAARYSDDALLAGLLQRKRAELAMAVLSPPTASRVQTLSAAKILNLWGVAPLEKVDALLQADGVEAVPLKGRALLTLCCAEYGRTELGPEREYYLSIMARQAGAPIDRAGFFLKMVFAGNRLFSAYRNIIWGQKVEPAEVVADWQTNAVTVAVDGGRMRLHMAEKEMLPWKSDAISYCISNQKSRRCRSRFDLKATGGERPFDPERDAWRVEAHTPLAEFLARAEFHPSDWTFAREAAVEVSAPEPP